MMKFQIGQEYITELKITLLNLFLDWRIQCTVGNGTLIWKKLQRHFVQQLLRGTHLGRIVLQSRLHLTLEYQYSTSITLSSLCCLSVIVAFHGTAMVIPCNSLFDLAQLGNLYDFSGLSWHLFSLVLILTSLRLFLWRNAPPRAPENRATPLRLHI